MAVGTAGRASDRAWLRHAPEVVFAAAVVVAVPFLLHAARDQWFYLDEWAFIADRDLMSPRDLLRGHNGHWVTTPVIIYRLIFQVAAARTYWPYVVPVITAHVASVVLLRALLRRAGVQPWIATAAVIVPLFFGTAREDLAWGFQVTFTGGLAVGLGQALLADRRGRITWIDGLGVACGLAALTFSATGALLVGVAGLACLLRRDWVRTGLHLGLPGAVMVAWTLAYGGTDEPRPSLSTLRRFVGDAYHDTPVSFAQVGVVAVVVAVAMVAGAALSWDGALRRGRSAIARTWGADGDAPAGAVVDRRLDALATVAAASAGALAFPVVAGWSRAVFYEALGGGVPARYVHVVLVLALPALAVGVDRAAAHGPRPWSTVAACALLLVGLPGNVDEFDLEGWEIVQLGDDPDLVTTLAVVATEEGAPGDMQVLGVDPPGGATTGWLQQALAAGDLPDPPEPLDPAVVGRFRALLSMRQVVHPPTGPCEPLVPGTPLAPGDVVTTDDDDLAIAWTTPDGAAGHGWPARDGEDGVTVVARRPVVVQDLVGDEAEAEVCHPA